MIHEIWRFTRIICIWFILRKFCPAWLMADAWTVLPHLAVCRRACRYDAQTTAVRLTNLTQCDNIKKVHNAAFRCNSQYTNHLTTWTWAVLQKLTIAQLVKATFPFMKTKASGTRFSLLWRYAKERTFRNKPAGHETNDHPWTAWLLIMGLRGCPETSVTTHQSTLNNIPEERRSHLHLKSRVWYETCAS